MLFFKTRLEITKGSYIHLSINISLFVLASLLFCKFLVYIQIVPQSFRPEMIPGIAP